MKFIFRLIISFLITTTLILNPVMVNAETAVVSSAWIEDRNILRTGATSTYTATKVTEEGVFRGIANITPTASDVAKRIVKTGGVLAVVTAIDLLLDGVDWVLDPANNQVRYKPKLIAIPEGSEVNPNDYAYPVGNQLYFDPAKACERHLWNAYNNANFHYTYYRVVPYGLSCGFTDVVYNWSSSIGWMWIVPRQPEYTLSYDIVAQKIIDMANSGDVWAQIYVGDVADEIARRDFKEAEWERTKEKIPQDCQMYIKRIYDRIYLITTYSSEKGVRQRYYELLLDKYGLFGSYKGIRNPLPGVGSWDGHIEEFRESQGRLGQAITETPLSCYPYLPPERDFWLEMKPPANPNPTEANLAGFF